ncbi:MAG: carboxypeptidase-like regulatory domain-containing protein, partial [Bryobacteraceae bacterium]
MQKLFAVFVIAIVFVASAFGQAAGLGGISGVVRDATGAAVPGASVLVANESKGIRRQLESNSEGAFNAPALVPAEGYSVSVSKSGFASYDAKALTVSVGQNVSLRIDLSVQSTTTQVDVTVAGEIVEDTKTDVSQLVNGRQILDLPINGRRVDSFVLLSPGVAPDGS